MPVYAFEESVPELSPRAYVHPDAVIIGAVRVAADCFIGAGAVLRGDFASIEVGEGSNVQENCVVHVTPGQGTRIDPDVIVGHGAVLHDVRLHGGAVVGMGAVLLQGAVVEPEGMVAAGSVVSMGFVTPARTLVAGNPARVQKALEPGFLDLMRMGLALYQELPARYRKGLRRVET